MKIVTAADHAGFALKEFLVPVLREAGYTVEDLGTDSAGTPSDYPDWAELVGDAVRDAPGGSAAVRGLIVCGSGVGADVAANKLPGVRASVCHDVYSARQGVEHDDLNVLCLGGRVIGIELAREVALAFAGAVFSGDERHRRRLEKVRRLEERALRTDC